MASLEEAQEKYRVADKDFLAARKAFDECPADDSQGRVKTAETLLSATAALNKATMEYVPFITGRRPNIRLIE
jgi:hypothetical protein